MDTVASVMERIKGFAASSVDYPYNPIEILKHLQRDVFSELMKLRDRQHKVESMFSFYKSVKGSPLMDSSTHMTGTVDVSGALLFVDSDDQQAFDILDSAVVRTGIDSRFIFEATVRQTDALTAEFVAGQNGLSYHDGVFGSTLALAKVMYMANINDCLSVASIPLGARFSDFGIVSKQGRHLSLFSSFMPPVFSQYHSCGAGLIVKGSKIAASFAELVPGPQMQPDAAGNRSWLSTFWQINYRPFKEARVALSGLWQMTKSPSMLSKLGALAIPVGSFKRRRNSEVEVQASSASAGSFALMLESEFDEGTNIGFWVEAQKLSTSLFQWGFFLSDTPEDELGWGLRLGGKVDGQLNHFQLEGFLNYNLGKRVILQPCLVYATDGRARIPALVFRSSWSL